MGGFATAAAADTQPSPDVIRALTLFFLRSSDSHRNRLPLFFIPQYEPTRLPPLAGIGRGGSGVVFFFSEAGFRLNQMELQREFERFGNEIARIDQIVTGTFMPCGRPAEGGESLGHGRKGGATGTLGCVLRDAKSGEYFVVSCNHVIAEENTATRNHDEVWQPGFEDSGSQTDRLGVLHDFAPLVLDGITPNYMDAALAKPDKEADVSTTVQHIGKITGYDANPPLDTPVRKSGKASGLTHGALKFNSVSARVPYINGVALFQNQYVVFGTQSGVKFARGGDSGSIVVNESNQAVGVLFSVATYNDVALVNPIEPILNHYSLEFP